MFVKLVPRTIFFYALFFALRIEKAMIQYFFIVECTNVDKTLLFEIKAT